MVMQHGFGVDALRHNLRPTLLHFVPHLPPILCPPNKAVAVQQRTFPTSDPEYSPDWPSDLVDESEDESEAEEFDLANVDGMKSKLGSDIDVDSDVEVEEEDQTFSLATEFSKMMCSLNSYFHRQKSMVMMQMKRNGYHLEFHIHSSCSHHRANKNNL
ncbi:hypothetical protein B0H14DRAFT_2626266 [Mycena olivaceomarginata]|nr:hypothetical protein B0H14DRAFT_2626266 [Mycena olivaceomarginata]